MVSGGRHRSHVADVSHNRPHSALHTHRFALHRGPDKAHRSRDSHAKARNPSGDASSLRRHAKSSGKSYARRMDPSKQEVCCVHTEDELRAMYQRLHRQYHNLRDGGKTLKILLKPRPKTNRAGEFAPVKAVPGLGVIALYPSSERPPNPFRLLCTLCHELGHAQSWIDGTRSPEYEAALDEYEAALKTSSVSDLPASSKRLILDEEIRAWHRGFPLARGVGYSDMDSYSGEARRALDWYFQALDVTPEPFVLEEMNGRT